MEDPARWASMDPKLREAACKGNVNFLKKAISLFKPPHYWLSRFVPAQDEVPYAGNILHLAIWHAKIPFLTQALSSLPPDIVQLLLRQQEPAGQLSNSTPALLAIKLRSTSCTDILTSGNKAELIKELLDVEGNSPLFLAVQYGLDRAVMNLLNSRPPLCCKGPNGLTALHVLPGLSHRKLKRWRDVSRALFQRLEEQISSTSDNGLTLLHKWVEMGSQSWDSINSQTKQRMEELFNYFFQHYSHDALRLMVTTDHHHGNNPLHLTANSTSEDAAILIAQHLIGLYKTFTLQEVSEASNLSNNQNPPWLMNNYSGETPLVVAICNKLERLASYFLSVDPVASLRSRNQHNPFILAVSNGCYTLAKEILVEILQHDDLMSILPFVDEPGADTLRFALRFPETFIEEVKERLASAADDMNLGSYKEYRVFNLAGWPLMDTELKDAACSGDIEFLEEAIVSKSRTYWLSRFTPTNYANHYCAGNILHLAIWKDKIEFVEAALEKLPEDIIHLLLCHQETTAKRSNWNPLHVAVSEANHSVLEMIVECDNPVGVSLTRKRAGLTPLKACPEEAYKAKDYKGRTPALLAIEMGDTGCADLLTSEHRAALIQDIVDNDGNSPLFLSVHKGLCQVVLNLLRCNASLVSTGPNGLTALHVAPGLLDQQDERTSYEVYGNLFEKLADLINVTDSNGLTVLHKWVEMGSQLKDGSSTRTKWRTGKVLLETFFQCYPHDAIRLMLAADTNGNNPLHHVVISANVDYTAIPIVEQLVSLYRKCTADQETASKASTSEDTSDESNLLQSPYHPWLMKNDDGYTPFLLAIHNKRELLASRFLSIDPVGSLSLPSRYNPFILAICNECYKLAKEILSIISQHDLMSLLPFDDGTQADTLRSALRFPETFIEDVKEKLASSINQHAGKVDISSSKTSEGDLVQKKDAGSGANGVTLGSHQQYQGYNFENWPIMDPELKRAACEGDLSIFKKVREPSTPRTYCMCRAVPTQDDVSSVGNIFHLAILHGKRDFFKKAMEVVPVEIIPLLLCQQEEYLSNQNPLHLAVAHREPSLVEMIVDCNNPGGVSLVRKTNGLTPLKPCPEEVLKAQDSQGRTPALLAIEREYSVCANFLTERPRAELIKNIVDNEGNSPLFLAVYNNLPNVILNLLGCADPLPSTGPNGVTALHVAPRLSHRRGEPDPKNQEVYRELFRRFEEDLFATDDQGLTMLHTWVQMRCQSLNVVKQMSSKRLFKYFFNQYTYDAVKLMFRTDQNGNNPLHLIATSPHESKAIQIAGELIELYRKSTAKLASDQEIEVEVEAAGSESEDESSLSSSEEELEEETTSETSNASQNNDRPWLMKNNDGDTPLLLAIRNKKDRLACHFLSVDPDDSLCLSNQENPFMLAVRNGCRRVARQIVGIIAEHGLTSLIARDDGYGTELYHLASDDPEIIKEVVEAFPLLIRQPGSYGKILLEKASEDGNEELVDLLLRKDPSLFQTAPCALEVACKNGHVPVILSFMNNCPYFKGFCLGHQTTPLHHIKLDSYAAYKQFLTIHELIEQLRNTRDAQGSTPLHNAIRRRDINLAQALLTMNDVHLNIRDNTGKTAMDLLAEVSKDHKDWETMCRGVDIDPKLKTLKTTYVQRGTNLLEMREALLVVAALLATITFTAGFTLPGGFNNDTGEALLAKRATFIVFILADTYALCCSMMVLFCLIWSMATDSNTSMPVLDRSLVILLQSLYASLVAFMTGVFIVIYHHSLWVAIVTIVMCSIVGISSLKRRILYKLVLHIVPAAHTEYNRIDQLLQLLGKPFTFKKNGSQTGPKGDASTTTSPSSEAKSKAEVSIHINK